MEAFKPAHSLQIPIYFNLNVMSHSTWSGLNIFPSYQSSFADYCNSININSLPIEEESQKRVTLPTRPRRLFPRKRAYKKKSQSPNHNHGKWTTQEENLYLQFISNHASKNLDWFEKATGKKRKLYFKAMSEFIGTRTPGQCRSKDQKIKGRNEVCGGKRLITEMINQEETEDLENRRYYSTNTNTTTNLKKNKFESKMEQFPQAKISQFNEKPPSTSFGASLSLQTQDVDIYFNFESKEPTYIQSKVDFYLDDYLNQEPKQSVLRRNHPSCEY